MSLDKPIINIQPNENINHLDRIKKFEEIKTPDELRLFMEENINYGFIGKDDEKIYSPKIEGWGKSEEQPEQKLQNPKELLESSHGTCWEQTELERKWFQDNNFEFKTFLLMFGDNIGKENPAHTLLTFKKDNKWYWFENSIDSHKGIHPFETLEELIKEVKKTLIKNVTENDIKKYKLYEYDAPTNISSTEDFISQIKNNK